MAEEPFNQLATNPDIWQHLFRQVGGALVFAVMGLLIFALAFWIMNKLAPFSLHKEIEEDQNTALSIVMGSVIIGIAIIIAAAIHG